MHSCSFGWKGKSWTQSKLTTLIFFLLCFFVCGCGWILQQVCCFNFLLECSFQVVFMLKCLSVFVSADIEWCRINAVDIAFPIQETPDGGQCPPHPPLSAHFFSRCSALSLCSMHLGSVPDVETNGEDCHDCSKQFYLSNGEICLCSTVLSACPVMWKDSFLSSGCTALTFIFLFFSFFYLSWLFLIQKIL